MRLLPEAERVLQQIEELSGKAVRFVEDRSLDAPCRVVMARGGAESHLIRYQPTNAELDYRVTFQAAYALRLLQRSQSRRADLVPIESVALPEVMARVKGAMTLSPREEENLAPFSRAVMHWVLTRLMSLPVGLRIDTWIRASFPVLHSQQEAGIAAQQQLNFEAISNSIGRFAVPQDFAAASAAHAIFADRLLGRNWYAVPYRALGLLDLGARLLTLNDNIPTDPNSDPLLIDRWAEHLGVRRWYRWVPFDP